MADFKSHSRAENDIAHHFRERLSHAENAVEARTFFARTIQELLARVLGEDADVRQDDVTLAADGEVRVSERLAALPAWRKAQADSDLGAIVRRFAEAAQHRVRHLGGHPEKTQSKIRGRQGH
jgi:hypothetical protein